MLSCIYTAVDGQGNKAGRRRHEAETHSSRVNTMTEEEKNEQYLRDKETREKIKTAFLFSLTGMMLAVMEVLVYYALNMSRTKMEAEKFAASQWYLSSVEGYYFTKIFAILQTEILLLFFVLLLVRGIKKLRSNKPEKQLLPVWVWLTVWALVSIAAGVVISGSVSAHDVLAAERSGGGAQSAETLISFYNSLIKAIFFAEASLAALVPVFVSNRKRKNKLN